ncbi:MAG: hypothetical protein ACRC0S_02045 [Fusobacteriaceae bacterium]
MKNLTIKAEESLLNFLKESLKDYMINEKNINFIQGYLAEESLKNNLELLKTGKTESYPLLILRRGKFKQSIQNGVSERMQMYKIILGIKADLKEGYEIIQEFGDKILNLLSENPYLDSGYVLEQDNFEGGINNESSGGDYWLYEIDIKLSIPVIETRFFKEGD